MRKPGSRMVHKFFAITQNRSVYSVTDRMVEGYPLVQKRGGSNGGGTLVTLGQRLNNGHLVAIGPFGICMFNPHPRYGRKIEDINTKYWGGTTSSIVALFFTYKEAWKCLETHNLKPLDIRFFNETQKVLQGIGENHPVFEIADSFKAVLLASPTSQ